MTLPDPEEWPVSHSRIDLPGDLLAARAEATPDALALVDAGRDRQWTYDDVEALVAERAARLAARRDADSRVALALSGGLEFAVTYFATGRIAASAVPLNLRLDRARLARQAAHADVGLVVCDDETAALARDVAPATAATLQVDAPGAARGETAPPETGGDRSLDAERLVAFTSGTTGDPKGVRLTCRNLLASAAGSAERLGVDPGDRWLAPLPTYHMGGLAPLVRSTAYGTTTVLGRSFDATETAETVDRQGVTALSLVPTMLVRLLDAGWDPPERLRFVLLGGAPADAELVDRALARGVPVCPTYGLTETASQVATATPAEAASHPDSVGRPLSTVEVSIRSEGPCETGETGEIHVDGPVVTPGYLDDVDGAFGEWGLRTGDVGYRDGAGRLWVVGRVDDRIVTGGENVHPARVAAALRDLEGVEDAAVVGLPDEEWGQRVAALVVGDRSPDGIRAAVAESLAAYEVPKTVVTAGEVPRTASGTVDREAVRDRLAAHEE